MKTNYKKHPAFKGMLLGVILMMCIFSFNTMAQVAKENLRPAAIGKKGMVATANPLASLAGQQVLAKGGNAIDAIVAAAASLNAVEPYMSGTAGVGFMLFYSAEEDRVRSLAFGGWVPKSFKAMSLKDEAKAADGAGHGAIETVGPRIVAIPGNLAGWNRALEDYGTMSLKEVFEPTIAYLEDGVPITEFDQAMWRGTVERVRPHKESRAILFKDGENPYEIGDIFTNKPLAKTMRRIADEGIEVFYQGDIAEQIAAAFKKDGGFITVEDLAMVPGRVQWTDPISIDYRGYKVYNNPPPGMGIQQLQTLKIMEGFDLQAMGHNSTEYLAHLMEAIYLSRIDTDKYVGDPDYVDVPVDKLLSDSYLDEQRKKVVERVKNRKIADRSDFTESELKLLGSLKDKMDPKYQYATTSLSAMDQWGNAVVIIQTHGGGFGSGYVAGKTGLIFNSAIDWMEKTPGLANSVEPWKAVGWCVGGMMQFHKDGKPELVVGSPGSFGILQSVPQVAMNYIDFGMNIQDAISAPRFRWKDELGSVPAKEIIIETRVDNQVLKSLRQMGYLLDTSLGDWSMTVGGAQGVSIDRKSGWIMGGADPRRNGYAVGW
ncbi:MAG: gamma-glutamyltransferase [Cytophagales bacterium]|uniref:gamma-glutamyltransferase n=1 Tax=Cyclobacterium marinum TaxID=104 RepID=UPI0030DD43F6|nr:gamma-glutamyltransferase [Cytophagales bacterium]|tara:strand:- start:3105 stop:4904 length:1800 start_codon:yes stop_codon:yes gene_type:complete